MASALLLSADPAALAAIESLCRARGHVCHACSTIEESERILARAAIDLAILDLPPGGMSPDDRRRFFDRPGAGDLPYVLAIGELAAEDDAANLVALGADDYLVKPYRAVQLGLRLTIAEQHVSQRAERRQVEASLRETVDLLALAASGTNDGFWHCATIPADDYFAPDHPVWYSSQMKALMGFADHEMPPVIGSWTGRLHPDDRDRVFRAVADHLERRTPYDVDYRLRLRSDEYRWFNARGQACWDSAGRPLRIAGSLRDITERRNAEDALRESEARHRLIADTVNDIIWTIQIPDDLQLGDPPAKIADALARVSIDYISPAIERVLGYVPEEARTLTLGRLLSPSAYETVLLAFLEEFGRSPGDQPPPEQRTLELEHVAKSGEIRCCEVTSVLSRDSEGRPASVMGVSRDVTDRRRSEQTLSKERAFLRQMVEVHERERSIFAYEIHDGLMSRITAARMHLDSSEAATLLEPRRRSEFLRGVRLLEIASSEARRLISGLRPPILDEAGIVVAIEYLVNEHRPQLTDVKFVHETQFDRLAPPLENAVFRVVQEALSNTCRHSGSSRARVELVQAGNLLRVAVRDWGIGFHPHQVSENHFGLQGIRERARLLGGHALIDSAPGQGALVSVEFPLLLAG